MAVLELEENLPDVDSGAHTATLVGTLVPVQEALLELVPGIAAGGVFHFALVAEFLLEVRYVRPDSVEDENFGLIRHHCLYADGGYGVREFFPVGTVGRNPLCALALPADGFYRLTSLR